MHFTLISDLDGELNYVLLGGRCLAEGVRVILGVRWDIERAGFPLLFQWLVAVGVHRVDVGFVGLRYLGHCPLVSRVFVARVVVGPESGLGCHIDLGCLRSGDEGSPLSGGENRSPRRGLGDFGDRRFRF